MTHLGTVDGVVTADDLAQTVDAIAELQQPDGLVLWSPGGHADPWNHVEAAMALALGGRRREAEAAYEWLAANQLPHGGWHAYYTADGIEDPKIDTNACCYVATGVWHHWLLGADRGFLEAMWPVVERAVDFVLSLQTVRGEIPWACQPDGKPWAYALLTGSSSICHSLRCATAVADTMGEERPDWELAAANLAHVIAEVPGAFAPKARWAMDWYYPVLAGVLRDERGRERLRRGAERFVVPERGVRCVDDEPWVTAAETCEAVIAHVAVGEHERAAELFAWAQAHRCDDGAYLTGIVYPDEVSFPAEERTSYTAAAVVLAADALSRTSPASGLFLGDGLPPLLPT